MGDTGHPWQVLGIFEGKGDKDKYKIFIGVEISGMVGDMSSTKHLVSEKLISPYSKN